MLSSGSGSSGGHPASVFLSPQLARPRAFRLARTYVLVIWLDSKHHLELIDHKYKATNAPTLIVCTCHFPKVYRNYQLLSTNILAQQFNFPIN